MPSRCSSPTARRTPRTPRTRFRSWSRSRAAPARRRQAGRPRADGPRPPGPRVHAGDDRPEPAALGGRRAQAARPGRARVLALLLGAERLDPRRRHLPDRAGVRGARSRRLADRARRRPARGHPPADGVRADRRRLGRPPAAAHHPDRVRRRARPHPGGDGCAPPERRGAHLAPGRAVCAARHRIGVLHARRDGARASGRAAGPAAAGQRAARHLAQHRVRRRRGPRRPLRESRLHGWRRAARRLHLRGQRRMRLGASACAPHRRRWRELRVRVASRHSTRCAGTAGCGSGSRTRSSS